MTALELFGNGWAPQRLNVGRAMSEAITRSLQRTALETIAEHQLIRAKISDMGVGVDAALLVYRAAGSPTRFKSASPVKAATESFIRARRVQSHRSGCPDIRWPRRVRGRGGTAVRHSRAFRIFDGTSEISNSSSREMLGVTKHGGLRRHPGNSHRRQIRAGSLARSQLIDASLTTQIVGAIVHIGCGHADMLDTPSPATPWPAADALIYFRFGA